MVLCFGEILLRYSPLPNGESFHMQAMPVHVGGAELNVAFALANWKIPVAYFTAMPENFLSQSITQYLSDSKINTSKIKYSGNRLGVYYLLQGKDVKSDSIEFDRTGSAFAHLQKGAINWDELLKDVTWFHFSAIAASLTANTAEVCKEALQVAKSKNITVSVDLNYRKQLWQYGKQPKEVMTDLVQYCDVIMGNIWSANSLLGIDVNEKIHDIGTKDAYLNHALRTSENIKKIFPRCKAIANTFRFDGKGNELFYYTTLFQNNSLFVSPQFYCESTVDKVGSGDCFMAGLIYGFNQNLVPQDILNFASAAAFGKLQEAGDTTKQSVSQVNSVLEKFM